MPPERSPVPQSKPESPKAQHARELRERFHGLLEEHFDLFPDEFFTLTEMSTKLGCSRARVGQLLTELSAQYDPTPRNFREIREELVQNKVARYSEEGPEAIAERMGLSVRLIQDVLRDLAENGVVRYLTRTEQLAALDDRLIYLRNRHNATPGEMEEDTGESRGVISHRITLLLEQDVIDSLRPGRKKGSR